MPNSGQVKSAPRIWVLRCCLDLLFGGRVGFLGGLFASFGCFGGAVWAFLAGRIEFSTATPSIGVLGLPASSMNLCFCLLCMQCVRIVGVSVSVMLCCFFSVPLVMSGVSLMSFVLGYCCQSGSRVISLVLFFLNSGSATPSIGFIRVATLSIFEVSPCPRVHTTPKMHKNNRCNLDSASIQHHTP